MKSFSIEATDAKSSLREFALQSGTSVLYQSENLIGVSTHQVIGNFQPSEALQLLLEGTPLGFNQDRDTGAFAVFRLMKNETKSNEDDLGGDPDPLPEKNPNHRNRQTMNNEKPTFRKLIGALFGVFMASATTVADAQDIGMMSGRVMDVRTGEYLEDARISIEEYNLRTTTDKYGEFSFSRVPIGTVDVDVFYTGFYATTKSVTVDAGVKAKVAFELKSTTNFESDDDVYELEAFEVVSHYDAIANAIHEQRFSESNVAVVNSDALGNINEGNIGEFVKFLPGISINYVAADVRSIEVRGLGAQFTNVTIDGNTMASAASSSMTRTFELEQVSLNNVERIEVWKVPMPNSPANSLGGSVNLVSKSAFERDGREIRYNAYFSANSEALTLGKTGGPGNTDTYKILPGVKLTYADVFNDGNMGLVVNYLSSNQFNPQHRSRLRWSFQEYADGLSDAVPVLRRYQMMDGPKNTYRQSFNVKLDYKLSEETFLLSSLQWNDYRSEFRVTDVNWDTNIKTRAQNQTSEDGVIQSASGKGKIDTGGQWRDKYGDTWHGDLKIVHKIGDLKLEAGGFWSRATNHYRSADEGFVEWVNLSYKNVDGVVRLSDYGGLNDLDNTVTVEHIDSAGVNNPGLAVSDLEPYYIHSITPYRPKNGTDEIVGFNVDGTYRLDTPGGLNGYLKAGTKYTSQERHTEDIRHRYYHVGADGKRNSADDYYGNELLNDAYAFSDPKYGFDSVIAWPDFSKVYDIWESHPEYFTARDTGGSGINDIEESILALYAMASIDVFGGKGSVTGGVRWEQTNVEALGDQDDRSIDSDYSGFYPSIALRYDITEKLVGRLAYARTIGRQDFGDLIPNATISYPEISDNVGQVKVNNTGLKPLQADNFDLSLEYYTDNSGVISVGYFHKDISDYFRDVGRAVTEADIAAFNLPEDTLGFGLQTQENAGSATVDGFEFNLQQQLTFLPQSIGEVSVFVNGTFLDIEGDFGGDEIVTDLAGFVNETYNLGLAYEKAGFSANVKFSHKGRELRGVYTSDGATAISDMTYYNAALNQVDMDFEYRISSRYRLYISARNINNDPQDRILIANSIGLKLMERSEEYGVQYSIGVKGKF